MICMVMLTSFFISPLKASANSTAVQNDQLIQLLMQMITILQSQLAILTSDKNNDDEVASTEQRPSSEEFDYDFSDLDSQNQITYSFHYVQNEDIGPGRIDAELNYKIKNYRTGLVLDITPKVFCDDTYIKTQCHNYVFDITGKGTEKYFQVPGEPYVKGGASYRISAPEAQIGVTGYVKSRINEKDGSVIPDYVDIDFIIRDINQGGKDIWSKTERIQYKG